MALPLLELLDLPVAIEAVELAPLALDTASGWRRRTTVVRLLGPSATRGEGEDVTYDAEAQDRFQRQALAPLDALRGRWTLAELSARVDALELPPASTRDPWSAHYRRWAVESAALALALEQAGTDLGPALGLEPRPVRYVVSTGLGSPPGTAALERVLACYPDARFKVDLGARWTRATVEALAALGRIDVVDLKGLYRGAFSGPPADAEQYRWIAELLPDCWLEDPELTAATRAALAPFAGRITWDAALHSVADLESLPVEPRCINVKPSRSGTLEAFLRIVGRCRRRGIAMYGGGQFELGPGRRQIQALAALFYGDAPNDVAPAGFNAAELARDLPASPLAPPRFARG